MEAMILLYKDFIYSLCQWNTMPAVKWSLNKTLETIHHFVLGSLRAMHISYPATIYSPLRLNSHLGTGGRGASACSWSALVPAEWGAEHRLERK